MLGRRQRTRVRNDAQGAVTEADDQDNEYGDEADAEWQTSSAGGVPGGGPPASAEVEADEDEEGAEGAAYESDDDYDDEYEESDDEYDEYDDDADEYDEDADEEQDGEEAAADHPEPFTPPTFLEAAKQAFRPKKLTRAGSAGGRSEGTATAATSGRTRAQPATGTSEDAQAVNMIDRRERTIGFVLGAGLLALSLLAYNSDRHYKNKDLHKQLLVRHAAVEVLAIFAVIGALTILATFLKRRALLGFVLTFGGLALLQTLGLFGIIYLGAGGWLIFRSMQRSPRSRARQAALAAKSGGRPRGAGTGTRGTTAAGGRTTARTTSGAGSTGAGSRSTSSSGQRQIGRNNRAGRATTSRGAPSPSGRYTPPKQTRRPLPPKQPEPPEPSNRLTAWLRK